MSNIDWQFHFRVFHQQGVVIRCHHAGCGMTKWHDGRPCCWKPGTVAYGPTGSASNDVYCPSNFVVRFGDWWPLIKDGLRLLKDVTMMCIPPYPPGPKEIKNYMGDVFGLYVDVIKEVLDDDGMTDAELQELFSNVEASFEKTCQDNNMDPSRVKQIANQMNLGNNWALLAGRDYWDNIHGTGQGGSPIVGDHGWSMFRGPDGDRRIAKACFLHKGHFIYPVGWKDDIDNYFWADNVGSDSNWRINF